MADEISSSSQLSIVVDLTSSTFNFKSLYSNLSSQLPLNSDHHYWHFGGLRFYTIPFQSNYDETTINNIISKLRSIQNSPTLFPPFWISYKECQPQTDSSSSSSSEVIKKNLKLGKFQTDNTFQIEYTSGSLVQLNKYVYDRQTEIKNGSSIQFYYDRIDFDYGGSEELNLRKTFKAEIMDRCAVIMTEQNSFTLFINMTGNSIDYTGTINDKKFNPPQQGSFFHKTTEPNISYRRTASQESKPFYSTIRLVISIPNDKLNDENREEQYRCLKDCYTSFIEFFHRNHINDCFGNITSVTSTKDYIPTLSSFMNNETMSFIQQYCWQMLLSIGYRFQQRLTEGFIRHMNLIKDDDEFYQTSLHIWRRSSEYYFIDLLAELHGYQRKIANIAQLTSPMDSRYQESMREKNGEQERWSIHTPPCHYAYVPSVTLTPTTICVKPLKLVKTNRVLRAKEQFGGHLMFALVDIKEENCRTDIFPHDYRALRSKTEKLLQYGFDLGKKGRTYRYLHHSQSQLKDKQFWFYYHDGQTNFSFEKAFAWMGDFQEEKVVAKHAARIAQCFTSAEATFKIPSEQVEYIKDIQTDDHKYNFTDGVGTMSTAVRDMIDPHRKFAAIQIRYGGCKGVISVNPDLDDAPHQLRIRKSMKKFNCTHDILEICRISKPRPLYLNRQIIVLLSHRSIDDRRFLILQNEHQQGLSESLVYPDRAHELLAEKLNRNLFPLRSLINDAHLNLIQEPFFRQLLIAIGKVELAQMKERTRLKLPKNAARNMIGIVDEYGVLEYGQVFIQYTELNGDYMNNNDSGKAVTLQQKVVVTKNPCHHPGDIRVFSAVDVPQLRHLKDVIVFPQRGERPHPNEISGSDLDGDEYAVIWYPPFIPETPNDIPYDYDSQIPMLRIPDRPVERSDIQKIVLDISEQSCAGKLCTIHLAYMDLFGVAHPSTLAIAGYISQELDSSKTGHHPLQPKEIMQLQSVLGNKRPDYFDKPYHEPYPSKHILGQLFRSCLRFESNWETVQTPPTTVCESPIDPLLVHDLHYEFTTAVKEIGRIYREAIMDILYVYRFSSDVDLLCRFDSSLQYRTTLSKQQTESACLIADSAQVELKQLIRRIRKIFYEDLNSCDKSSSYRCHSNCIQCAERKMAKASALYIFCYTDTQHARRMLSLPWLFAPLLIKTRQLNIKKQTKLLSPMYVAQMLEIQPFRLIGQSLRNAVQHLIDTKESFYFQHTYSPETPTTVTLTLRPISSVKRLFRKLELPLIDYLLIEVFHHYVSDSLSEARSPVTATKPALVTSVWQHILTRFVLNECSPLLLLKATNSSKVKDLSCWSDEQACMTLQRFIDISTQCADHGPKSIDYAHAHEYFVSILQKMATTGSLFSN
ncbi:unnamed protein product [Adineta steineri]|uniref:RNA-dependent RNA polymerase n=1 Tax=Adineta steineri TaxID=433720 RepID=A0A814I9V9_9BILA|nr:unnamed protein product [Adineta steineri]CAF3605671.1 unnamed protein product [Adineta steineri]